MSNYLVTVERTVECPTAVVSADPEVREARTQWRPLLDQVWAFLRHQPGLWSGGHNVMVYANFPAEGAALIEAGVQVTGPFAPAGAVRPSWLPGTEAATTVHTGGISDVGAAHDAVREWCANQLRPLTGRFWEIYGDPHPGTGQVDVTVYWELGEPDTT
jgi:hypothetical protein